MQITLDGPQAAFASEVRAWLAEHVPADALPPIYTEEGQDAHHAWERKLYAAGYSGLGWPKEFGGGGLDVVMEAVFNEEYIAAGAPERINRLGIGLAGPSIMAFGTQAQKDRWLKPILTGEEVWCQGFSEPDAGSDLASVRTRGRIDGDEMVITGQKIWTSSAPWAAWMFALVRTSPGSSGRDGLSFVMLPMNSPGIEVRPIEQIGGTAGFAEVFLTDVRVPVANVIGEVDQGWQVAMATLGFERGGGVAQPARFDRDVTDLIDLVKALGLEQDPFVRDAVAARYAETQIFRRYFQHVITRLGAGRPAGPEASVSKLYWSQMEQRIFETARDALGERAEVLGDPAHARITRILPKKYWYSRASTIYAGASEIQRNIIAERLLGLPKEPRWKST